MTKILFKNRGLVKFWILFTAEVHFPLQFSPYIVSSQDFLLSIISSLINGQNGNEHRTQLKSENIFYIFISFDSPYISFKRRNQKIIVLIYILENDDVKRPSTLFLKHCTY